MNKLLYKLTVKSELNGNEKILTMHMLTETYEIAEWTAYIKLSKGGFNIKKFQVLEVENLPYINC